jgi:GTPase SAR1 family protein
MNKGVFDTITKLKDYKGNFKITIIGDAGIGKTSLAATFPSPVFIRTEDGVRSIKEKFPDIGLFPRVKTINEVFEQVTSLIEEKHDFKTLVIDSITAFSSLAEEYILSKDKAESLAKAQGGYGAGYEALSNIHRKLHSLLDTLHKKMHLVFLVHRDVETYDPPDSEAYTREIPRLHKKVMQYWIDGVCIVGFLRLRTVVKNTDTKNIAVTDGTRIIDCHSKASRVSKNRVGIKKELIFKEGVNPFEFLFKKDLQEGEKG